jgi:hypothetical protein
MNTLFLLMAEYETVHVPLETIADKYLGLCRRKAFEKANRGTLPFPALRSTSQQAPWLVDLRDVAKWFDQERMKAKHDFEQMK